MAIDRRDFLKFVVGGAVGTIFSPLPWVSMNEVAKWSQRWAPIPEKGGTSYLTSTCKLCPGSCGIRVRLIEEKRAVKIDGNPFHPVNRGGMCPLGLAALQYLYHEDVRIKTPLKRMKDRGQGGWKPISWDEALSEIGTRLKDLRQKDLSHTVVMLDGQGMGSQALLAAGFLKAYGSPNYIRSYQAADLEEGLIKTLHGVKAHLSYDLPRSKFILSFGCALMDGWGNPVWVAQAFEQWRQGPLKERAKIVQVDTMATTTASLADEWIAVNPETEGTLALGLAQVILDKGWTDPEFVRGRFSGMEGLKDLLNKEYTPDRVAKITGVPPDTIQKLARDFTTSKPSMALWGKGKEELPVSFHEAQAVHLLNVLAGSINRPGGLYLQSDFPYSPQTKIVLDKTAEKGFSQPRIDQALSSRYPNTGHIAGNLFAKTDLKKSYPINALFLNEVNPVFSRGEKSFKEAAEKIPFIVSFSPFMDETTSLADLVLPAPTFLERWDDSYYCQGVPFPIYGLTKPILPPLYGSQSLGDVLLGLAKDLGGKIREALPFETMEGAVKQTAKGLYESKKGRLADGPPPEMGKATPAAFESFDQFWGQLVTRGTWYQLENKGEEIKGKGTWEVSGAGQAFDEKTLWMIPESLILLQSGYWPNPPFLTKYLGEETLMKEVSVVQVHPRTARDFSLREGDMVEIQSAKGKISARVHIFEGARPNCFFIPLGLGHTAFDPTLKDRGANVYPILDAAVDPITGLEVAWSTKVRVKKIETVSFLK